MNKTSLYIQDNINQNIINHKTIIIKSYLSICLFALQRFNYIPNRIFQINYHNWYLVYIFNLFNNSISDNNIAITLYRFRPDYFSNKVADARDFNLPEKTRISLLNIA